MPVAHRHKEPANALGSVMFRFGSFLLACVLWALDGGHSLSQAIASLCQYSGLCGLAFYFSLEQAADQRTRQASKPVVYLGDHRLSQRMRAETKMAKIIENERVQKR